MRHPLTAVCIAASLLAVSCTKSNDIDERLLTTYTSYVIERMTPGDSALVQQRLDSVLTANGYTPETFFNELSAYGKNPELMRTFYDSARGRIGRMQAEISR
ncbi:MAG: hypothetical protein ACK5BQ_02600 [Ignavibacteria bacterium]|jgi:hypothetical protein